jgi:hypothetical protein
MTLARATDRIESARLVLRRVAPGDLPFFTRIHAVADVVRYTGHGRPRSAEETQSWLESTIASYEEHELGQLAVLRKADGALLGRCGLSDLVVETRPASNAIPRAWFGRAQAPAGLAVTQEQGLGLHLRRDVLGPRLRNRSGAVRVRLRSRRAETASRDLSHRRR